MKNILTWIISFLKFLLLIIPNLITFLTNGEKKSKRNK